MQVFQFRLMAVLLSVCAMLATPISANVFTVAKGFQTVTRGTASAKGVVFYFGGHSPSRPTPMTDNIIQPHVASMNKRGWDVYRANPPIRLRNNASREQLAKEMNELARDAKKRGYKRVVFVGQSFGAWNILMAAQDSQIDKYVAFAPACCGLAEKSSGNKREAWEQRMLRIVDLVQQSKVRGLVFLFEDDEFYSPRVSREVAKAKSNNVLVVDKPPGFIGHGSAWLDAFDYAMGDCLEKYLSSNSKRFSCPKKRTSNSDHRWMATQEDLVRAGSTRLLASEFHTVFVGNTLAGKAGGNILNIYFSTKRRFTLEFRSGYNNGETNRVRYRIKGNALCADDPFFKQGGLSGCYSVLKWPNENMFFAVSELGGIVFKGQLIKGNARGLR